MPSARLVHTLVITLRRTEFVLAAEALGASAPWGGLFRFWWVYLPVTVAMILFGVTWNLIGDGINDTLAREV